MDVSFHDVGAGVEGKVNHGKISSLLFNSLTKERDFVK
jgi:hypothetical protein